MTMARADLVADLKASLHDAAEIFASQDDAAFVRLLDAAASDLVRVRPRMRYAGFDLAADQIEPSTYLLPADFCQFHSPTWGVHHGIQVWEAHYPGRLPQAIVVDTDQGKAITLIPAVTPCQLQQLGRNYRYRYFGRHEIGDTAAGTSVALADRGLLLLRAQAEAMRELAMRNIFKPVALRDGMSQAPRNGTPAALYQVLLDEFLGCRT
ncbi:hypothetical protein IGB42_02637 [Andreprevotia sp. IGB-42]|uniref:hypothetical protein n=1 Tax=Andreprevotia sp. IGB-42 TaxID=2497473 RepID=UPI0013588579|nr:hypothetical protein [Andreprevotia sp. IGB-42]KAF0812794.1 hypothetical protein IGB42_02637 [Andreprevotia sp. IGB-42]